MARHAFVMELDPLYCDVMVQRWQNFTGKKGQRPRRSRQPKKSPEGRQRRSA